MCGGDPSSPPTGLPVWRAVAEISSPQLGHFSLGCYPRQLLFSRVIQQSSAELDGRAAAGAAAPAPSSCMRTSGLLPRPRPSPSLRAGVIPRAPAGASPCHDRGIPCRIAGNVDAPVSHRSGHVANDRRLRSTRTVEILSTQKSCGTGEGPLSRCRRPDRVYWMPARARQMPMDLTGSHVHD